MGRTELPQRKRGHVFGDQTHKCPLCLSLALQQPRCPAFCSSNTRSLLLPQDLCTWHVLYLEHSSICSVHVWFCFFLSFLKLRSKVCSPQSLPPHHPFSRFPHQIILRPSSKCLPTSPNHFIYGHVCVVSPVSFHKNADTMKPVTIVSH